MSNSAPVSSSLQPSGSLTISAGIGKLQPTGQMWLLGDFMVLL